MSFSPHFFFSKLLFLIEDRHWPKLCNILWVIFFLVQRQQRFFFYFIAKGLIKNICLAELFVGWNINNWDHFLCCILLCRWFGRCVMRLYNMEKYNDRKRIRLWENKITWACINGVRYHLSFLQRRYFVDRVFLLLFFYQILFIPFGIRICPTQQQHLAFWLQHYF